MLEFPNIQCSQNAMTAAGNLLISIHKMINQTQIATEKELVQNGKLFSSPTKTNTHFDSNFLECDRLLLEFIPQLCTIINTSSSRSSAQIALDTIKDVLEEVKLDMLKQISLLEKIAHCVQKVLAYKVKDNSLRTKLYSSFHCRRSVSKRMMRILMTVAVIIENMMVVMMQNTMQC